MTAELVTRNHQTPPLNNGRQRDNDVISAPTISTHLARADVIASPVEKDVVSLGTGNGHVMSLEEFEQLPPEEPEELPAMWEDGGGLSVIGGGGSGFRLDGKNVIDDGELGQGQWAIVTEESVRLFGETADDNRNGGGGGGDGFGGSNPGKTDTISFEQRSCVIEQTLSEIYESPFKQITYAANSAAAAAAAPPRENAATKTNSRRPKKSSIRFDLPDDGDPAAASQRHNVPSSQQRPKVSWAVTSTDDDDDNDNDNGDDVDSGARKDDVTNGNANNGEEEGAGGASSRAASSRLDGGQDSVSLDGAGGGGGGGESDLHSTMKASIARAARRAVSGYRTCEDADRYVGMGGMGARPTLILARAPPSPSGILRRTNKKAPVKVGHGNVRWADGRTLSVPTPDDVIHE